MASPKEKAHSRCHFSHEHPLQHTNSVPKPNTTCYGCNGRIFPGHDFYECKMCAFSLHQICHDMPKKVGHPSDPNHQFTLQLTPVAGEETHNCKACGYHIVGLYYTCHECKEFYHILCLLVPLSFNIPSHIHSVKLQFSPPYDFECDLCKEASYKGWLYHCESCEFDAHINCAIKSKGEEWIQHGPMARDKSHELMELIAQGMNDSDHLHLHLGQLSPSLQFSEALFSIDFAKSLLRDEYNGPENKDSSNKNNEDTNNRNKKNDAVSCNSETISIEEIITSTPKGIGRDIWSELGRESEKKKSNAYKDGTDDVVRRKLDTDCLESSCWSSFLLCLRCERT